ncbi:putative membrane protein, DedA family, type III (SNARE domain) [Campylobacter pinnipediorum subsp. caledonicus]|uniref:Putative membrane protein, DedA family, type III (SNARE domain) n=1 Tax=Campylobacter pinnipediorum subsp. caledonicus TaxID=1874362 RepID=A0A1S6U777_9BACT|nr:DedA family protein [Campylobacter pinnipediorum]AQW85917.1 putative membrane protein, DedA family, type III (SNARE domain) [Campylobacter pinnipediorum subsp. caledonicus]AQW87525.1 putative membrane protein, DedA family, type III (SNARE domain) [Campylobacter pinnipediorum subsp. caledonicus]OPA72429.1 hypothetical protein BB381_01930 [Campylobacter pinnipediorum subsp. caledonicus]
MQDMLLNLSTYGYLLLFLYSLGGGMVAIIAAGVLSYMGKMDLNISIIVACAANFIGDNILFYIGRYNKDMLMPYLKNQKRKLAYSQILMKKHGNKMIFIQKYIYGVKTLIPIAIGLTKYSFKKFIILNLAASVFWALLLGNLSYYAGDFVVNIEDYFGNYSWSMPVFLFVLLGSIWLFLDKKTKKVSK